MKNVMLIFGTRPEAIKMAPVIREITARGSLVAHVLVTAQHRQMLDQVLDVLEISADSDLDLMRPSQSLAGYTALALEAVTERIRVIEPDLVLVHGDTSTAFAASLAGYYNQVPVGHIEAGLRTQTINSPFPEEANRRLVGRLASVHFAPTNLASQNLLAEGVDPASIVVTGNTVIDSLQWVRDKLLPRSDVEAQLADRYGFLSDQKRQILVTNHRRENFGPGMEAVFQGLSTIAKSFPDVEIVFPLHLNPRAREPAERILGGLNNVFLIGPAEYVDFIYLMSRSHLIITDSGGIQEEAPSLNVPVLVTRESTERPEALEAGTAILVGTDRDLLVAEATRLLTDDSVYQRIACQINPYGDGQAARRIVDHILTLPEAAK